METTLATVDMVGRRVDGQLERLTVKLETAAGDTIGDAPRSAAEEGRVDFVLGE